MWTLTGFADEIADDFVDQLDLLNALGVTHLEFRSAWGTNILKLDAAQRDEAKRLLDEYGISVSAIGSPIGKIGIEDDFEPHLDAMRHAAEVAHFFGTEYIRMFSFFMPAGKDPADYRDEVMRRMKALVGVATEAGVTLLHENEKDIYGDVPARCLDLVETIASPNLKVIIDPANFVQCGVDPLADALPVLRPHVVYMHMKDAVAGTPRVVPVGEGDGRVPELLDELHRSGFDGFFSLEPHLGEYTEFGAMTGPDLWARAHEALVSVLRDQGIAFR